jgi:hypothetical protein
MIQPKLRLLSVQFDTPIDPWELPAFRGAVARKAGWEHELFHNHNNSEGGYHHRIPLIQYKQEHGRPMLVCLNEGIEELQYFFSQPDWTLELNGRTTPMRIAGLDVKQYQLDNWDKSYKYHIRHWIALNEDNYKAYGQLTNVLECIFFLQNLLKNQVVGLLHQLHITPEQQVALHIQNLKEERWVTYKKVKLRAFSLEFTSNVLIPDYLGLGKGSSLGWGIVKGVKNRDK